MLGLGLCRCLCCAGLVLGLVLGLGLACAGACAGAGTIYHQDFGGGGFGILAGSGFWRRRIWDFGGLRILAAAGSGFWRAQSTPHLDRVFRTLRVQNI